MIVSLGHHGYVTDSVLQLHNKYALFGQTMIGSFYLLGLYVHCIMSIKQLYNNNFICVGNLYLLDTSKLLRKLN